MGRREGRGRRKGRQGRGEIQLEGLGERELCVAGEGRGTAEGEGGWGLKGVEKQGSSFNSKMYCG